VPGVTAMDIATTRRKIWSGCVTGGCQEPMSKPDIVLTARSDVTPEQRRDVRARVWRFVLSCHAKKGKGGAPATERKDLEAPPIGE
jgi:hypothetical protein